MILSRPRHHRHALWQDLQKVGVEEKIWLVTLMRFDLGFFDHETCRIESAENPFAAKVLPMCPE